MDAKAKRDRLFKRSRPFVRPFDWAHDFWVLWGAYDLESFDGLPKGWTKEEFAEYFRQVAARHSSMLVIEDDCKGFRSGRGPCALVSIDNFGWRIEPHVDFFRWTSARAKLRCTVSFLHMVKNDRTVGVCLVRSLAGASGWFKKLSGYGVLYPCGFVPKGDPRGDEYLFSIGGRRAWANGTRRGTTESAGEAAAPTTAPGEKGETSPAGATLSFISADEPAEAAPVAH